MMTRTTASSRRRCPQRRLASSAPCHKRPPPPSPLGSSPGHPPRACPPGSTREAPSPSPLRQRRRRRRRAPCDSSPASAGRKSSEMRASEVQREYIHSDAAHETIGTQLSSMRDQRLHLRQKLRIGRMQVRVTAGRKSGWRSGRKSVIADVSGRTGVHQKGLESF
eukprot:6196695-Pleurochrysis_carterae.AAC.3